MANSLVITKLSDGSFSFVVNGDTANTIINLRNDLTTVGNEAHFKTSEGANLIKLQQILYNEVTIVNGATLPVATSSIDLRLKLRSVGFWDWLDNSGGGSVIDRFDELEDTFQYFGNDGKVTMVDESQLKLIPYELPDFSLLNQFPQPLVSGKYVKTKSDGTGFEYSDAVTPILSFPYIEFDYTTDPQTFTLPDGGTLVFATMNNVNHKEAIQTGADVTISNYTPSDGYTDTVRIHYQI